MQYSEDAETVQQMRYIQRLIQNRIGKEATRIGLEPLWYRCLSDCQMEAADSLHVALADDILEGTTYRVNLMLHRLGIHPKPPKSGLLRLFEISRGSDVAFLWFLMEAYYMSRHHENFYGSNEQILMSTIFWLDLFPTLRALDRVLPLPHPSAETRRKEIQQAEREKRKVAQKLEQSPLKSEQSILAIQPYFENPMKPKSRRRNLLAMKPLRPATLLTVRPETSNSTLRHRWFGAFDFEDGHRIAKRVLHAEVNSILSSLEAAKLNSSQVETLCTHHQMVNEVENSLRLNLEQIRQEKRRELLNVDLRYKERIRKRTLEQLDRMTEYYRRQFHDMAIKTRMTSTRKQLCFETNEPGFVYVDNGDDDENSIDWSANVKLLKGKKPWPPTYRDNTPIPNPNQSDSKPKCQCKRKTGNGRGLNHRPSTVLHFLQMGGTEKQRMAHEQEQEQNSPNKYFECQDGHNYRFNYRKLFAPSKSKLLSIDQLRLRAEFLKALDADVEYLNAVLEGEKRGSMGSLVDRSAKQIFRKQTERFQQEYDRMMAEKMSKSDHRLDFGQEYYDPNNKKLMEEMLKVGLDHVAQDHRYVLPTLPNVHLVPLLTKWICARYGKLYTSAERKQNYQKAKYLMNHLMHILTREIVRRKSFRPVGDPRKLLSLKEQHKISQMLRMYWSHFIKYFAQSMIELGRIFHNTMEGEPGTKTTSLYYCYMPAHIMDIEFSQTSPFANRQKH